MMPRIRLIVSDPVRYCILHSVLNDDKVSEQVEKEVKPLKGPPKYGTLPVGTVSEIVRYKLLSGWFQVKAHQYRLPTGDIRGGPDPLYILIDDVVLCRSERRSS